MKFLDTLGAPQSKHFLPCCPQNNRQRPARTRFKYGRLSFPLLLYCHSFLLPPTSSSSSDERQLHSYRGPLCSVCAGMQPEESRSVQGFAYSKSLPFRCTLLSSSELDIFSAVTPTVALFSAPRSLLGVPSKPTPCHFFGAIQHVHFHCGLQHFLH